MEWLFSHVFLLMMSGLVGAWERAETDAETVPAVDGDNGQGEMHQFLFAKLLAGLLVDIIQTD